MDVCMAFLRVDLEEEIYMHPRQGFFCLLQTGSRYNSPRSKTSWKIVLWLRKSLHGLKQSRHVWYGTFEDLVISSGFEASHVDGGLFMLHVMDKGTIVAGVVLYDNNLLLIANDGLIGQIKDQIKMRFRMHDLGSVSFYLGMNIEPNREHHTIDIYQHSNIPTILVKFRMDEWTPITTPMAMKIPERKPNEEAGDPIIYQPMIGSFMYTMAATRPHITYAIGVLPQYNHVPSNEHMVALSHVFRYLNYMKDWRVRFRDPLRGALAASILGGGREGTLGCYVNPDYAGCPDDYELTSGLLITFGWAVDWRTRNQMSTAQSLTDAEHYALGVGRMILTQISHLLNELGIPTILHVCSDSQSQIVSIKNRI